MSILSGAQAILEGFGENPPPQEVAQARSDICTGRINGVSCPFNHKGGFSLTTKASQIIHAQRQRKLELRLAVEGEESLGVCKLCKCYLPLKIWFDISTIFNHTPDEMLSQLPSFCWVKKGCQSLTTTP